MIKRGDKVWYNDGQFVKLGFVIEVDGLLARVNPYLGDHILTIPIRRLTIADDHAFDLMRRD